MITTATATTTRYDLVSRMPEDMVMIFHNVSWDEYVALSEEIGETHRLRLSFNDGTLKVMSLSPTHEKYADFIKRLVAQLSFRLRINILFFGSATMRKRQTSKGNEPDASFYVQKASAIGNRIEIDFAIDPPPDVVVEVDIHHASTGNDPIYAALGVPEIWRYDGWEMSILRLEGEAYIAAETSLALPMLSASILTEYLERLRRDGEFAAILAFDEWLQSLPQ
jgi:Uma2 family endonuclease